jgi:hypothetical protein
MVTVMYLVEQEGMLRLILEDMCEILMISEAERRQQLFGENKTTKSTNILSHYDSE